MTLRRRLSRAIASVLWVSGSVALLASPAGATETDQFLAWQVELEDAADVLNEYLNVEIDVLLGHLASKKPIACEQIPQRFFRRLFPSMMHPRIRHELIRERGLIERFPRKDVGYWSYLHRSVYRRPLFPFILPMARTIQIGGIRLGGDKLGHMLGHGRHYYHRYLKRLAQGATTEEAQEWAVHWGIRAESLIVGGLVDGVFSHADLEANFQGMQLARRFCEGKEPFLELDAGRWRRVRPVEIRQFVNPDFDESYNNSSYSRSRWKRVKPILVDEYCDAYWTDAVQSRLSRYREMDSLSLSRRIIRDEYQALGRFVQVEQNIATLCRNAAAGSAGAG